MRLDKMFEFVETPRDLAAALAAQGTP